MEQLQNINKNEDALIIDFEQIFLCNKEINPTTLTDYINRFNIVAIISRCGIKKLLAFFDNFSFLQKEQKDKLYIFARRCSIFYAYDAQSNLFCVYQNNLDDITKQKLIDSLSLKSSIKKAIVEGNELTLLIEKTSQISLFSDIDKASEALVDFETRIKNNTEISISKSCKNNCECFSKILKELSVSQASFLCKTCNHKKIDNILFITY